MRGRAALHRVLKELSNIEARGPGSLSEALRGVSERSLRPVHRVRLGDETREWGPPWLGPLSAYFLSCNRNKKAVTLDLSRPEQQLRRALAFLGQPGDLAQARRRWAMTQINPFTGAIVQGMQVQPPRQSAEKDRQIRRVQNLSKNSALQGDQLEHQVESADAPHAVNDGQEHAYNPQRRTPREQTNSHGSEDDGGAPHVDVTA